MKKKKELVLNADLIAFKKNKIVCNTKSTIDFSQVTGDQLTLHYFSVPYVIGLQLELMNLGFYIDPKALFLLTNDDAKRIGKNVLPYVKELIGIKDWTPLYEGFPAQVQEMSRVELFIDQIMHYLSDGTWMPSCPEKYKVLRETKVFEKPSYIVLNAIDTKDLYKIFESIVGSKNSITNFDKKTLEWFINNKDFPVEEYSDIEIPFKENLCMFLSKWPNFVESSSVTINDILRAIVYSQGGDITLPKIPKSPISRYDFRFKNMPQKERKYWMNLIDQFIVSHSSDESRKSFMYQVVCDMKKYEGRWIRLGEILHPGSFKNRNPFASEVFFDLRNHSKKFKTWNSKVQNLYKRIKGNDLKEIIEFVSDRPGEFIRRFDSIWRRSNEESKNKMIDVLMGLGGLFYKSVSSKVLLEFFNHIDKRNTEIPRRISVPNSRTKVTLDPLSPLPKEEIESIKGGIFKALMNNFSKNGSLKDKIVVLDPTLEDVSFPSDMRTLSEGKMTIPRGTKIPFDKDQKVIRFYTHWVDPKGGYDLDLHASFVSETKEVHDIGWNASYGNLKNEPGIFSGDVRNRVGDCAEYIDIQVQKAINAGYRYVLMQVNSYNGQPFNSIESYIGFTYRDFPKADILWKPEQVVQSIRLNSSSKNIAGALVDLKEGWIKIIDEDWNGIPVANYNYNTNIAIISEYSHNSELNLKLILKLDSLAQNAKEIITLEEYESRIKESPETQDQYVIYKKQDFLDDYTKILNLI
jgi:hypothetical protein